MTTTLYSANIPAFKHMLSSLDFMLMKAEAYCAAKKIDPTALTTFRLAPDMFTMARQVQIACDGAKNSLMRVGGLDVPKFTDDETTLAQLRERVAKTIAVLDTAKPEDFNGKEDRDINIPTGRETSRMMKADFALKHWITPNVYFHVCMVYAILRHNGVDVGKQDYLMGHAPRG